MDKFKYKTYYYQPINLVFIAMLLISLMPLNIQAQTKVLADEVTYTSGEDKMTSLVGCGSLLLEPCYAPTILDPNNALQENNSYARLLASPGLAAGLGSYKGIIELKFPEIRPADSWSYVKMKGDSNLFRALLGGSLGNLMGDILGYVLIGNQEIIIDARMGETLIHSGISTQSFGANRIKLIQDAEGNYLLGIKPEGDYDRIRITNQTGSLLGLGIEKTLDIYNAFYYEDDGDDCGRPIATSFDGGGGIELKIADLDNQNLNHAIDTDMNTYSTVKSTALLDLSIGSTLSQHFYFPSESSETATLNIKLALGSGGLVNTDLLGAINVILYNANDQQIYKHSLQSSLLNNTNLLNLLDNGNPITVTFAPGKSFVRAEVQLNSPIELNLLGDGVKIYDVQRYDDASGCPNPEIAIAPDSTVDPFDVASCATDLIDFEHVDFPLNAVDDNNETYATLHADSGNLLISGPVAGFIEIDLGSVEANKTTYVRINYDEDVLERLLGGSLGRLLSDLGNNLLLGNQYIQVEALSNGSVILNEKSNNVFSGTVNGIVELVEDNIGRPYLAITPFSDYDSIRITNHVTAVLPTGKKSSLDVYNACFEIGANPCFPPNFTSFRGGGVNLSLGNLSEAGVTDPYKAISSNSSEYSKINLGIANLAAHVYQSIYFNSESQSGDHIKIRLMVEPSSLLSLDLLGTYKIRFFNGLNQVGSDYSIQNGLINNIDLLALFNSGGTVTLDFEPEGTFDRVDIGIESIIGLNVKAEPLRVYEVSRYGNNCAVAFTPLPFESPSCATHLVDSHNADDVQNLFDDDFDSYATLKSGAGFLLGLGNKYEGYVEMGYDQIMSAGTTSYVRIDFDETILKALISGSLGNIVTGLLDGLIMGDHYFEVEAKMNTYDNNGKVTSSSVVSSASSREASAGGNNHIRVVQDAAGRYYIAITPDQQYNAVRITDKTNSELGFLSEPNTMNVYGMCTELSEERCLEAFATSYEYSGVNLSVTDLSGAGVTNAERALNDNTQHYSEISNGTLGVGASTKQWVFFNTIAYSYDAVEIKFKTEGGGVDLDLLGGLEIKAYMNNDEVAQLDFQDGIINGINVLDLLNNNQIVELIFTPEVKFNRISVGIKTLIQASVFPPVHLYGVKRQCGSSLITNPMIYQTVE